MFFEYLQKKKKVVFHKEDMYMERLYKNFAQDFIDITADSRDLELSDS